MVLTFSKVAKKHSLVPSKLYELPAKETYNSLQYMLG